jgi:hypothetical protein
MRTNLYCAVLLAMQTVSTGASAAPAPVVAKLEAPEADKQAIQVLLSRYTGAVSNKNQHLFETLLLNEHIPFSRAMVAVKNGAQEGGTQNYEQFRRGVFEGPAFTQRFQDIEIRQDGPLADVTLVFVNTSAQGVSWGWKTLQLLKVAGQWKIASEFYTSHG